MQELDTKIAPYTLMHTLIQSQIVCESGEMYKDSKSDDVYITKEYQMENEVEPTSCGRDSLAPIEKTKLRIKEAP